MPNRLNTDTSVGSRCIFPGEVATTSFAAWDPLGPFPALFSGCSSPESGCGCWESPHGPGARPPSCARAAAHGALKTRCVLQNFISLDNILSRCEAPLGIPQYYLPGKRGERVCAGVGEEFSAVSAPLTPGERQVPGAAELNRSREWFSLAPWLPEPLETAVNQTTRLAQGAGRSSSPGGAGAQVSAAPASPAGPGCARPPAAPKGSAGRAA